MKNLKAVEPGRNPVQTMDDNEQCDETPASLHARDRALRCFLWHKRNTWVETGSLIPAVGSGAAGKS